MIWREFKAMGTDIVIMADLQQDNLLVRAEEMTLDFAARFSRFIPGNELDRFNNPSETTTEVSSILAELLHATKYYYSATNGIFDPTIITNLEALGYDRTFAEINPKSQKEVDLKIIDQAFKTRIKMDDLQIEGNTITRPLGFKIDLGGIGKGYIVDLISRELFSQVDNYWISAGGDILASGHQENNIGWDIKVQNPLVPEQDVFSINTQGKKIGIATSGIIKRKGLTWHHIIDSRSGLPANNNILSVTIISTSAIKADVWAKTVLVLGEKEGLNFIENSKDSAGVIFSSDKEPTFSKNFPKI